MFKEILYCGRTLGGRYIIYRVYDSEHFPIGEEVRVIDGEPTARKIAAIISIYEKHNLPVIPNIVAFYYRTLSGGNIRTISRFLDSDKKNIDLFFHNLEYGTKYYPCIYRRLMRKINQ